MSSMTLNKEVVLGVQVPRLWTPPLVELTEETSFGFDVIRFANEVLNIQLDPWEEWTLIHIGELLPDGRPRFRTVLILVARQNGKTLLSKVLLMYWLFVDEVPLVLATSSNREYAKQVWKEVCDQVQSNHILKNQIGRYAVRKAIGEETLTTLSGCRYRFAAVNRKAGRSLTVHRLLLDELREHRDFDAYDASSNAMNAVMDAQTVAISNQGDAEAVVLDALRLPAVEFIETGKGDYRLGLFEWSAPPGAEVTDIHALAAANPNLNIRIDGDALIGRAIRAKAAGGEELTGFKTEVMCMRVHLLDPAIDPDSWRETGTDDTEQLKNLAEHRDRVALCWDIAMDGSHACLLAAAVIEKNIVQLEVLRAWDGYGCTQALRRELPGLVSKVRPRVVGWFPNGPAAAVAAELKKGWAPPRTKVEEIKGEVASVCMGFAEIVGSKEVIHSNDPMLTMHTESAQKLYRGDSWVYTRKNTGPVDGAYAAAGATHLARMLPPPLPPLEVAI